MTTRSTKSPGRETDEQIRARALEQLRAMTPDQVFEEAVLAGIYEPSGELTEPYRPQPDEPK